MAIASREAVRSKGALSGIRVVEVGPAAAGPLVGKILANHGAEVIKVESRAAPDPFRTTYPPFKDNVEGLDRAAMFAWYNDGKRGITLNMKSPRGGEILRRLVLASDVVIESYTPGKVAGWGLRYAELAARHPSLVMLSSCNQGQTGPRAAQSGYGSQLTALAGLMYLLGEPDRTPVILYGPYIDYIAVAYGVVAILAALARRRRTGRGCYVDLSQLEAGIQFMTPALLEFQSTGRVPTRAGNADAVARPHGVYPAKERDRWVALSVWSDDEWRRLLTAAGDPPWRRDAPDLDDRIGAWTRLRPRDETVALLRSKGLRAAPVLAIGELFSDPQLRHRGAWPTLTHPVLGTLRGMSAPWRLSDTPQRLDRGGPTIGADNDYVYRDVLGLGDAEIASLEADGTFR